MKFAQIIEFTTERMAQRTVSLYRDVLAGATC